jgi:hypothetical protein
VSAVSLTSSALSSTIVEADLRLNLGRSRRLVTDRQFKALLLRDRHCSRLGCRSRQGLRAHHVRHRIHGGHTDLDELTVC